VIIGSLLKAKHCSDGMHGHIAGSTQDCI